MELLAPVEPFVVGASVAGLGHLRTGSPCQDRYAVAHVDDALVVAVADGMGSARLSQEGADAAVRAAVLRLDPMEALSAARTAIEARADLLGCELRALACTLSVCVWRDDLLAIAHIGDGAVVARASGELVVASAAAPSEYVNETDPLTLDDWRDRVRLSAVEHVDAVAAFTDGVAHAALRMDGTPSEGFFAPIFAWAAGERADETALADLLGGRKISEHSDDDKTLVVAVSRETR